MKRNKILAFVLSLCLTVGLLPTLSASASVKDNKTVKIESSVDKSKEKKDIKQDTTTTTTLDLSGITTTPISEEAIAEQKNVATVAVKKALKWGIRHMPTIIKDVESVAGKSAANTLKKYSSTVIDVLEPLMAYEDVTYALISDTVYNGLYDYVGSYTAKVIAEGVKYAIMYLSPV
jgi:hypothetical protein